VTSSSSSVDGFWVGFGGVRAPNDLPLGQFVLRGDRDLLRRRDARCASSLQLSGSETAGHRELESVPSIGTLDHRDPCQAFARMNHANATGSTWGSHLNVHAKWHPHKLRLW